MKNVTITKDRFYGRYDMNDMDMYYCTECEDVMFRGDNYCCNCGAKITWRLSK